MRSTSRKRRSNLRLAFAGPFPLLHPVARKVDGGEQQIAHLFFKLCFIHHGLLRFVHHFVDFFMDFVQYRAKRVPVKPYCRAAFWILWARIRAGRLSGMSSSAECWDFSALSALLICSQRASTSALLPAVASPKICGWRRSSLSLMAAQISLKLKRPSSCAICA